MISQLDAKVEKLQKTFEGYITKAKDILEDFWKGKNRASVLDKLEKYKGASANVQGIR